MKYFIDQEFIESFHKPWFGKRRHFIDLISISLIAEDGREYHAISNEYNYEDANEWVKENVIMPLYRDTVHGYARNHTHEHNFHKYCGKSNKEIAREIVRFVNPIIGEMCDPLPVNPEYIRVHNCKEFKDGFDGATYMRAQPEFWAYFGDYDWVLLCSLFGTMMDLPEGFPMYCCDVKQLLDERVREVLRPGYAGELANVPLEECIRQFELLPGYPVNLRPHLSKEDARQEKLLYEFLTRKL